MNLLAERLRRLRWLAAPMSAYLVVTLVLPAAHGAARRGAFVHHVAWVVAGCVVVTAATLAGGIVATLARRGLHRLAAPGRNDRRTRRVAPPGGPS